ncbi:hypothetical protein GGI42DRAFT_315141 [Trichoderma sp. SZMC 28013]
MTARPNSLARTQRQVQSSTADLLGRVPPALISISCSFGAGPRASLGQPPILTRLTSDPCPLAKPLEVYGADSVLARLWGEPSPNFGRHHEFRSVFLGPRSCFGRRQGLGQPGDRPLLASPFIALSSLPSLPFSLFKFPTYLCWPPTSRPGLLILPPVHTYACLLRSSLAPFASRQPSRHSTAHAELDPALCAPSIRAKSDVSTTLSARSFACHTRYGSG